MPLLALLLDRYWNHNKMIGFAAPLVGLGFGQSGVIDDRGTVGTQKLQASPASIMRAYLIENDIGDITDPSDKGDWPLYISHLPDSRSVKTNAGAIYDTTGTSDLRSMTGQGYMHPGIQIRIRSRDYETGYTKIEDIANALDKVSFSTITIGSLEYRIQNVSRSSPIVSLGVESGTTRRFHFTVNFLLTIREIS